MNGLLKKLGTSATIAAASLAGLANQAYSAIVDVFPSYSTTQINQTITNSQEGDTIKFNAGTYNQGPGESYSLKGNRDYTLENVVIEGFDANDGVQVIGINGQSNISIDGGLTTTLTGKKAGIYVSGESKDVNIQGIIFDTNMYGIVQDNNTFSEVRTKASVKATNCVFQDATYGVLYNKMGSNPTEYSSYVAAQNCTGVNVSQLISAPTALVKGERVVLGNDEINNNVLINCGSLSDPSTYNLYHSPSYNAYQGVANPYLGGIGNFVAENMGFFPGTYKPIAGVSPLDLENGDYIGAYMPVPEPVVTTLLTLGGIGLAMMRKGNKWANRK